MVGSWSAQDSTHIFLTIPFSALAASPPEITTCYGKTSAEGTSPGVIKGQ